MREPVGGGLAGLDKGVKALLHGLSYFRCCCHYDKVQSVGMILPSVNNQKDGRTLLEYVDDSRRYAVTKGACLTQSPSGIDTTTRWSGATALS
jgi:hypothetical protein